MVRLYLPSLWSVFCSLSKDTVSVSEPVESVSSVCVHGSFCCDLWLVVHRCQGFVMCEPSCAMTTNNLESICNEVSWSNQRTVLGFSWSD